MLDSPRPVDPAAPTVLSQYCPAPMIGESPTRPAILYEIPLVVVTEPKSPVAVTAHILIVPWVCAIFTSPSRLSHASLGFRLAFQRSQSCRLFSVSRFCSLNPISSANFL